MPTSLPKHPALIIRDLLTDNWTPANTASYDPTLTPSDPDFLPLSRGWYNTGPSDPFVGLTNFAEAPRDGGQTTYSGIRGDGSGVNQDRLGTGLITVFAERDDGDEYNGESAEDIVDLIRREVERIIQANAHTPPDDLFYVGSSWDGEQVDEDVTPVVHFSSISVAYSWRKTPV